MGEKGGGSVPGYVVVPLSELREAFVAGARWVANLSSSSGFGSEEALRRYPEPRRLREIELSGGAFYRFDPGDNLGWQHFQYGRWVLIGGVPAKMKTPGDLRLVADCWENPWEGACTTG